MMMDGKAAEEAAILATAQRMCAAARTAPKACGVDHLAAAILTGAELLQVAAEMERLSGELGYDFFLRDAQNLRASFALVLLGMRCGPRGLGTGCGYCGFPSCQACVAQGGLCAYDPMDLGIAIGSAVSIAADARLDNRVLFSAGRAALELGLLGEGVRDVVGIPLAAAGKNPYFDRKSAR